MDPAYMSSQNATYNLALLNDTWQIALVVLYSSTAVLAFASNVLAIYILLSRDRFTAELWKCLINLSVADIFMALMCIPFTYTSFMLGRWIFPTWMCPAVQFAQLCSVFVSVYTLTLIGFDRYFAIVYPFHKMIYLKTHKSRVLIIIWSVSIVLSSVMLFKTKAVPFAYGNETYHNCQEQWDEQQGKHFTVVIFVLTFGLPVTLLVFVYTAIGVHIIRHTAPGNPDETRDSVQMLLKIKVIKMLVTIVIIFIICWLPIHVHGFIVWFFPPDVSTFRGYMTYVISYFVCHFLAMSHSFLNPFIYGFMSENFKISFRKLFFRRTTYDVRESRSEAELEKLSNFTNVASNQTT